MAGLAGLGARLAALRTAKAESQEALAQVLQQTKSAVSKFELGKGLPSPENLLKLSAHFGVSVDYLLTGREYVPGAVNSDSPSRKPSGFRSASIAPAGSVFLREEVPAPYRHVTPRILTVQVGSDGDENIALVSKESAGGYAAGGFMQEEFIERLPSFRLPDAAYRNGTFRAFQVEDDSMLSTLYEGDWVICRYVEHWDQDIRDAYVHAVVTEEQILVKRLNNRLTERGQLTMLSDNPAYPKKILAAEHVREIWVAVGKLSRQFIDPRYNISTELDRQAATLKELLSRVEGLERDRTPK
jgi:transcriptional regulator with XRE-family HTH domain